MNRMRRQGMVAVIATLGCLFSAAQLLAQTAAPGLGPAGKLLSVEIESAGRPVLQGRDSRRQLIVTGKYETGQLRDLTHTVTYSVASPGIVKVDPDGFVTPLANGVVAVTAKSAGGMSNSVQLKVDRTDVEVPINFPNQIVPIFTKLGCNTGSCHGKSSGQNGFKLSLLGFYPNEDYEYLVKENRGRRIFPSAPEFSLLLLKPTNLLAHGGGRRLDKDSYEAQLLTRWIEQGMPFGSENDPVVKRIEVFPKTRAMNRGADQQIAVVGHFSDGVARDVTRMVTYESNDLQMAETTPSGLIKTLDVPGDAAVMIRFQGQVTVFRASIPLGLQVTTPAPRNSIDTAVFAKLKTLGIPPSKLCSDSTFIRRASIDITGKLPTAEQVQQFVDDKNPKKRPTLVNFLLESPGYGDYFANKWNAVLRNKTDFRFHNWIRRAMQENVPYDEFVRGILAATGDSESHPPVAWYREVTNATTQAEDTAQLFLGMRIQCARCHHHPFEQWSQNDYYGFTAFFSQVALKAGRRGPTALRNQPLNQRVYHKGGVAQARNPRTQKDLQPAGLGSETLEIAAYEDPRHKLVDWMAAPDNRFFARALVNRYWKHFFGRGIVEPEDDMRVTNPPTNPALLDALAKGFIASKFDLKQLIRSICSSAVYQLDSEPNEYNKEDKQNFSSYYPKRLTAEVLYDALNQVTNTTTAFTGMPTGTRAVQVPVAMTNNYFLTVFGKPAGASACECERSAEANLAQSLHLLNSPEVQGKLSAGNGRADQLAKNEELNDSEKITELYRWVYARNPSEDELKFILPRIEPVENKKLAYEDLLWALINTKEFLFNH